MNVKGENHIVIHGWMRTELGLKGNELLVYAIIYGFSQDDESRFYGSQQYLADWCGCEKRSIQNILNNLTDRGLLTKYEEYRNNVKYCQYVANFTTTEIFSPPTEKISPPTEKSSVATEKSAVNNIVNSIDYNIGNSSKNIENSPVHDEFEGHAYSAKELADTPEREFLGSSRRRSTPTKPKRQPLILKCRNEIYLYTQDLVLTDLLTKYLDMRMAMKDKPIYTVDQWIAILNKLSDIIEKNPGMSYEDVVRQSIERGYASFFPVSKGGVKKTVTFAEGTGLSCESAEDTAEERKRNLERKGRRSEF